MAEDIQTLERGDLYMVFRPKVGADEPGGIDDVQRFYMILSVRGESRYRMLAIGRKYLPSPEEHGGARHWGFVEAVARNPRDIEERLEEERYQTKTRGERTLPAARPVAEGVYRILRHEGHTHLVYALELPEEPGEVQDAFHIEPEASYIIAVKNPEAGSPPRASLGRERKASFPEKLQERFRGRRFADLDPPGFLDHEGAEIMLVAAGDDLGEELGLALPARRESCDSADIFSDLRMDRSAHPLAPLFAGQWQ